MKTLIAGSRGTIGNSMASPEQVAELRREIAKLSSALDGAHDNLTEMAYSYMRGYLHRTLTIAIDEGTAESRKYHSEHAMKRYYGFVAEGICPACPDGLLTTSHTLCQACRRRRSAQNKRLYHDLIARGICPRCTKEPLVENYRLGAACRLKVYGK